MLKSLRTTNFRKAINSNLDFTDGINTLRGANEASKSTHIESIAYALFGSKALRNSLDETVTWGEDVKTLRVEVDLNMDGAPYTFTRSKAGAEVLRSGEVFCTGQTEVSAFAAQLFGTDMTGANRIFLANQNSIRGALESGPKMLSQIIEDLAGFNQFDTILEAARNTLSSGPAEPYELRLKNAQLGLDAITANLPAKPNESDFKNTVALLTIDNNTITASLPPIQEEYRKLAAAVSVAEDQFLARNQKERDIKRAHVLVDEYSKKLDEAKLNASEVIEDNREELRRRIDAADQYETRYVAYQQFLNLKPVTTRFISAEQFQQKMKDARANWEKANHDMREAKSEMRRCADSRITHTTCDKCGQDITHLDTVKATNERVEIELKEWEKKVASAVALAAETFDTVEFYDGLDTKIRNFLNGVMKVGGYVEQDLLYPPVVTWKGEAPGANAPLAPRKELAALNQRLQTLEAAKIKLTVIEEQYKDHCEELTCLVAEFNSMVPMDITALNELTAKRDAFLSRVNSLQGEMTLNASKIELLTTEFKHATTLWDMSKSRLDAATEEVAVAQKALDTLNFNNNLIKKLRAIRGIIATKLWSTVLMSVSVMFSQIRGETSVITKEKDGFYCNDKPVESLSGSTLDALGIAIRVALLRTFLPSCPLLILDEPAHGMDESRTASLLGFINSIGMKQTLIVTHEEVSRSIATNVIEL